MKPIFAIAFAILYGLCVRLLYGILGNIMGIMSIGLMIICPVVIGFLTILLLPKKKNISTANAFFIPWLTCLGILVITIALNIEGTICWIMAYPLFSIAAGVGGVIAKNIRKPVMEIDDKENLDIWTKPDKLTVSLVLLVPVIFGMGEGGRLLTRKDMVISKSIIVPANTNTAWKIMANIDSIQAAEHHFSLSSVVGFPRHISTTLDTLAVGGKRKAIYEKGLYFNETISRCEPRKLIVLDIKTDPKNIPPTVMDEHIIIGGKHVDILQDSYHFEQLSNNSCRITLTSHFFINTPFNWYAGIWANYLMGDILSGELRLIKDRAVAINDFKER